MDFFSLSRPVQEAAQAEQRLLDKARPAFDEFQILRFRATNAKPFPFEWVDLTSTESDSVVLVIARKQREILRFRSGLQTVRIGRA